MLTFVIETNPNPKRSVMNFKNVFAVSTLIAALLPAELNAQAPAPNQMLVLTEESSTVLTATLDGTPFGTVINVSPDNWIWDSGVTGNFLSAVAPATGGFLWHEPESTTLVNSVLPTVANPNTTPTFALQITSDMVPLVARQNTAANGADGFTLTGSNGQPGILDPNHIVLGPMDVFFVDQGDVLSTIPDSFSTLGLSGLSLAALALARLREKLA